MASLDQTTPRPGRVFWTDDRLRRVTIAIVIGLLAGICIAVRQGPGHQVLLSSGDFPGFYSPAVLMHEGRIDQLYDLEAHHKIQSDAWPSFGRSMYISVYPPYFSAILAPLAELGPYNARLLWTVASVLAYFGTLLILRLRSPALYDHFWFVAASSFLFVPIFFGVLGGQNTAFSLLLFVGGARLLQSHRRVNDLLAGLLFGLWLFKPQFGLLAGLYLLLRCRLLAFGAFSFVAGLWWVLAAVVAGADWFPKWFDAASKFGGINFSINGFQMTSFAGLFWTLGDRAGFSSTGVLALSVGISLLTLVLLVVRRARSVWLLGPVIVLISPQTLFYDLSLALIACVRFLSFASDRDVWMYWLSAVGLGLLFAFRNDVALALPCFAALLALRFVLLHAAANDRR